MNTKVTDAFFAESSAIKLARQRELLAAGDHAGAHVHREINRIAIERAERDEDQAAKKLDANAEAARLEGLRAAGHDKLAEYERLRSTDPAGAAVFQHLNRMAIAESRSALDEDAGEEHAGSIAKNLQSLVVP